MKDKQTSKTMGELAAEKPEPGPEEKPEKGEHKWEPEELPADISVPVVLTSDDGKDQPQS